MNLLEMLGNAFSGGSNANNQAGQEAGLPPMTIEQQLEAMKRSRMGDPVQQQMQEQSQFQLPPVAPGMFSAPGIGPAVGQALGGNRGLPAPAGQPPLSGQVQGGPMVPGTPQGIPPGGNVYPGQLAGRSVVPSPQGAPAAPGRNTNNVGVRPDSGPIPMGGPQGSTPMPKQPAQNNSILAGIQNAFGKLSGSEKAGVGLLGAGAATSLPGVLGRIFGGDPAQGEDAQRLPLPDWATGGGSGGGGGPVNELPAAWRSQMEQVVPGIDWDNLPRPDYEQARGMLAALGPEAPEERNWLDRLPVNAKNMIGFGILLGPIGLLLGAGIGASANRSIDKAQADQYKQEAREHMREMIGFDLDWGKAERSMEMEEQQGRRDEALDNISLERQFQQWGMDDRSWQDDMQTSAVQRAAMMRSGRAKEGNPLDRLWQDAMMQAPEQVIGRYNELAGTPEAQMGMQGSAEQQKMYNEMLKATILRSLYGQ